METLTANINTEISQANKKFEENFKNSNPKAIADLYTTDATLLPPGADFIKGKQGIADFWQGAMKMGVKQVKLNTMEVQPCENTAIEMGTYTLAGEGGATLDEGKYMVVWQKQNDAWRLHKDIWNSSMGAA